MPSSELTEPRPLPFSNFLQQESLTLVTLPSSSKALSLKQMLEFIEEIYISKSKTDKKNKELGLARETMEQHLYSFLNKKYGLKKMIVEWAASLINGIRKYSAEDNTVAVFGKILRNECDEEFVLLQNQAKNTIIELYTVIIIKIFFAKGYI